MSIPIPFPQGLTSLLKCSWTLELITPLVIRASTNASIHNKNRTQKKGREKQYDFRWEEPIDEKEWAAIRDFNYEFQAIENDDNGSKDEFKLKLQARYSIPGSSIRGALRQWTIRALVKDDEMRLFSLPKIVTGESIDKAERMTKARKAVNDPENRWHDILSLFGIAYDLNPGVNEPLIWSGRLEMGTVELPEQEYAPEDYRYDESDKGKKVNIIAPKNIKQNLKTRSPLDRVTMAARSGGLHSGIEMSEEQHFTLEFRILNPKPNDLRVLKLWKRDLDAGFIRFGGLTSQGRGKVKIVNDAYSLFAACNTPLAEAIKKLGKEDIAQDFTGIWTGAELDFESLFRSETMETLNEKSSHVKP